MLIECPDQVYPFRNRFCFYGSYAVVAMSGDDSPHYSRILDFLHFAFNAHGLYDHSITNYMKPEALQKITW